MTDAAALARGFRDGSRSIVETTQAALAAIAADQARLNAVATLLPDSALAAAGIAERELRAGRDRGPLHGVPVGVKDLFAIAGVRTGFGAHPAFHEHPAQDSAVVARLREAGAVIVATTQMLEFAYGAAHPDIGQTCNPHDPARTSGGSSGGSAALVAAGHLPLAVGTDTGGSIRIPAAYCGIVGMKPSFGRVSLSGALPLSWTLDHAGPLARTVADARALLACLSGQPMPAHATLPAGLRLGVLAAHRDAACVTADARAAFDHACDRLRHAGAVLSEATIPGIEHASAAVMLILLPEATVIHAARLAHAPDRMAPATLLQLDAGAAIPAAAHLRARQFRTRFIASCATVFYEFDALLSPTAPWEAPAEDPPIEEGGGSDEMLCCAPANLAGLPALTLPCGRSPAGLPFGLHVTAARGQDARLLDIAEAIEAALAGPDSMGETP